MPIKSPMARAFRLSGIFIGEPLVNPCAIPLVIFMRLKVTMKGGRPILVIARPFKAPTSTPVSRPRRILIARDTFD